LVGVLVFVGQKNNKDFIFNNYYYFCLDKKGEEIMSAM
jgi:hypothetical protein